MKEISELVENKFLWKVKNLVWDNTSRRVGTLVSTKVSNPSYVFIFEHVYVPLKDNL